MNAPIAILVCTHDRPRFLALLLEELRRQSSPGVFLVIADNGSRSSKDIVEGFRNELDITYSRLEQPGLVVARNACLEMALRRQPEVLVFIDDDEVPKAGWLAKLVGRLTETNADFVTGPVEANYVVPPPAWAVLGDYFSHDGQSFRTSNLAMRAAVIPKDKSQWFRDAFNHLGGEDDEFMCRLVQAGAVQAVARDAIVSEFVPAERLRRRYIWRCGTRDGAIIARTILTRHGLSLRSCGLCAAEAAKKIGYAANHLFWSVRSPWRINSAIRDVNAAGGILLGMAGVKLSFYGRPASLPTEREA